MGGVSLHCLLGENEKWRQVYPSSFQASPHIPFIQESNTDEHHPISPIKNHKSQLLQILSYQEPFRDKARLSSLVNKKVALIYVVR